MTEVDELSNDIGGFGSDSSMVRRGSLSYLHQNAVP